jgi:Cu/Ag efflux protein CusF
MRKNLAILGTTALLAYAGGASAEETTGKIESIDMTMKTLTVDEETFQYSSSNTMGAKLEELEEGDTVKIMYESDHNGTNTVMEISKEE